MCSVEMISRVSTSTKVEKLRPYTQCWKHHQTLVPSKPYAPLHAKENIQKQLSKFCWVSRWMCVRFGSFFRHLWNISSNDYLKWFSTGKPKGQENYSPKQFWGVASVLLEKHKKNSKHVIKHQVANIFCEKYNYSKLLITETKINMWNKIYARSTKNVFTLDANCWHKFKVKNCSS